jgi:hypothetical protein
MNTLTDQRRPVDLATIAAFVGLAAILAGCTAPPVAPPSERPVVIPQPATPPIGKSLPPPGPPLVTSSAGTPREYRRDAAGHLYAQNGHRIFKGKMPPLLYAIGVFEVEVDAKGNVISTAWVRAPRHAPEVMAEIERTALRASPYPAPTRMGRVTYTDTWLWDKSGNFQLDTLTEGQL